MHRAVTWVLWFVGAHALQKHFIRHVLVVPHAYKALLLVHMACKQLICHVLVGPPAFKALMQGNHPADRLAQIKLKRQPAKTWLIAILPTHPTHQA
jgi:hypothetical protein